MLSRIVVLMLAAMPALGSESGERLFAVDVQPLLEAKCVACHGGTNGKMGGLDLRSREAMLAGGVSKKTVLAPGRAEDSLLYRAVTRTDARLLMPPKENDALTQEQAWKIRDWINDGAPWPNEATRKKYAAAAGKGDGVTVATSGGVSDSWTNRRYDPQKLWAYQPLGNAAPPAPGHPIDAFHQARLHQAGLQWAPRADKLTLVRRAYLDLTGLPPSPEESREYLDDPAPNAWEKLIDRLLASPHYGERWGQHWLDVARYADTAGNSNDYERSNAWRYRDYVIRSFNNDKPFDRFVTEQIAGDEMEPANPEMLVAVGFLRMGQWGSAMVPQRMSRQAWLDDVVNSVGQTFFSTPLRCAKCHDHKFDPIPTRDYYRVYAAFAGTQMAERPAAFLPTENVSRFDQERAHVQRLLDFATDHKKELNAKMEAADRKWYAAHGKEYVPIAQRKNIPDAEKPPRHNGLDYQGEGQLKVREQDEWIWTRRLERYEPMAQSVFNGADFDPGSARKLRIPAKNDMSWRPANFILTGGSVDAPGDPVTPGVLSAAARPESWAITSELTGRRTALARWIADPANPLSTRSIVNRVWQYHFGRGLAANPNNFGITGAAPTHPELLDWLTRDFVENGWRLKRLHRLIMTSEAYQQASERPDMAAVRKKDPANKLLAWFEPRRLTAEELRDAMLAISGELNRELGGLPVMPEINMEVALQPRMIQFSIAPAHQPSRTPAERNRRSIYAYRVRGQADPFLEVFNLPSPNDSCERRDAPSVSPQALTLMNSDVATDRSIAFALRVEHEAKGLDARIDRAFELAYGHRPSAARRDKLAAFVQEMEDHHRKHEPQSKAYPTRVTRSLVEEFSGRAFEYEELLNRFEDYVPDKKPWQVSAETRALADLCLILFNSNEVMYVY